MAVVKEYMGLPAAQRRQSIDTDGWHDESHEKPPVGTRCRVKLIYETYTATWDGMDWIDESGFRLRGVAGWMTFSELMPKGSDRRLPSPAPPPKRSPEPQ